MAPLVNTALPRVIGNLAVGETLSTNNGSWNGNPTFIYVWQSCDPSASSDTPDTTYTLTSGDVGYATRVIVTASQGDASALAVSALTPVLPLVATAAPTITGTASVGQTLSIAREATWNGDGPSIVYSWEWCTGEPIAGANDDTYVPQSSDVWRSIRLRETATQAYASASVVSACSEVVSATPPANTSLPTINLSGTTLSASQGGWSGPVTSYSYVWKSTYYDASDGQGHPYCVYRSDVTWTVRGTGQSQSDVADTCWIVEVTAHNSSGATMARSAVISSSG